MNIFRNSIQTVIFTTLILLLLPCCSSDSPEQPGSDIFQSFTFKGLSFPGSSQEDEDINQVALFQFSDGLLYKHQQIAPGTDGKSEIEVLGNSKLFFITDVTFDVVEKVTTEKDFEKSVVRSKEGDNTAPLFMSAAVEVNPGAESSENIDIIMKHGVARVDLKANYDSKLAIHEITLDGVAAETYAFIEGADPSDKTLSYTKTYDDGFNGVENGIFYIFESTRPVHATVKASYGDIPVRLKVELPAIARNKIYEIEILNAGATLESSIKVKDWEEGDTVTGKPDTDSRISISSAHSVIPDGVTVDFDQNLVNIPSSGADGLKLAFIADAPVEITAIEGLSEGVTIGQMSIADASEGIMSTFDVTVPAQTNGRLGYSLTIHLKNALLSNSYDFVEITVAPSEHQIETVEIGGSIWMAFNSRSPELEDQIYPLDGLSVEDMYRLNWVNTVGGLFQFGRKYMYIPWQGYKPSNNLGDQNQDIPWQNATHMPCPEGYRIPTREELESMFPKGTEIPGSYVAGNGEHITATIHTAEGSLVTPTNVGGTQRYVKFTSQETGRYLIIPLAGGKGDKSTTNNPGFGKRAVIWTNSNQGCPGGYALAYWMKFEDGNSTSIVEERLQMEAFASVRCVKAQ